MELIKYGTFGHRQERGKFVSLNRLSRFLENTRVFKKIPGLGVKKTGEDAMFGFHG
jgi:hypothetical protein